MISPDGMSFNDIKPVYRELLLKLAMTMSQDEIFQRSKTIMALNKKKRKPVKDGNTNLLMACSDSPLLKHEPISFKAPQQSHKVIDFDQ